MPVWGDIQVEIANRLRQGDPIAFDFVRRKYLVELHQKRGRAVILYATKWTQSQGGVPPEMVSITDEDLQALMTVMNGVQEKSLDIILHSPGGSIEAAEAIVSYLRSKFTDICVIVPQQAMSAATMISCAANAIVLGKHSFLGPTDPQFILQTELGQRVVTAQNIEEQFSQAQKECADPSRIGAWIPILRQYGPDLLLKCHNASKLSKTLITGWLEHYMFKGEPNAKRKAKRIGTWLSSHKQFNTHGRHLSREQLRAKGLKIVNMEDEPMLQDLALSVFHATTITFDSTPAVKLVENHLGKAFIKLFAPNFPIPQQAMHPQHARPVIPIPMPVPSQPINPAQPHQQAATPASTFPPDVLPMTPLAQPYA